MLVTMIYDIKNSNLKAKRMYRMQVCNRKPFYNKADCF